MVMISVAPGLANAIFDDPSLPTSAEVKGALFINQTDGCVGDEPG